MPTKTKQLIVSRLILVATPSERTAYELRESQGLPPDAVVNPCVFEVKVAGNYRYCCWAGGDLVEGKDGELEPVLTKVGLAAYEALTRLPFLSTRKLIFQQVKRGPTPIQQKIVETFLMSSGSRAAICFVGDLAKELDGEMFKSMNMKGLVSLEECVARYASEDAA